ncbi:winged helix-turn-helix domain-containing protein [Nonomuraea sp. GTA35]|uniref:AfsR/SARP family transcriptional regulator n=1 Tax=Nonomuraea sp. GTA35 TaxID=1676746 RepID=UPI0035BF2374
MAWFGVLGSLEVTARGRPVSMVGRNQRELLAMLLLRANHPVSLDTLVESFWPADTPATARRQIQNGVGRLRRTLTTGGVPGDWRCWRSAWSWSCGWAGTTRSPESWRTSWPSIRCASGCAPC